MYKSILIDLGFGVGVRVVRFFGVIRKEDEKKKERIKKEKKNVLKFRVAAGACATRTS